MSATSHFTAITYRVDANTGIARLTLNRPDRLNSFTEVMHATVNNLINHVTASKL